MFARVARSGLRPAGGGIRHPPRTARPSGDRSYATGGEPPRSQSPPASGKKIGPNNPMVIVGGVGLALGAVFMYLTSQPAKAKDLSNFGKDQGGQDKGSGAGA